MRRLFTLFFLVFALALFAPALSYAISCVCGVDCVDPDADGPCTCGGSEFDDIILGSGGDDFICSGGGVDVILASSGNDTIHSGFGDDVVLGGDGNDLIQGGWGEDTLLGEDGDDTILGGQCADTVSGGDGANDVCDGGQGTDGDGGGCEELDLGKQNPQTGGKCDAGEVF